MSPQIKGKWKKKLHVAWEAMSKDERATIAAALPLTKSPAKPRTSTTLRLVYSAPKLSAG